MSDFDMDNDGRVRQRHDEMARRHQGRHEQTLTLRQIPQGHVRGSEAMDSEEEGGERDDEASDPGHSLAFAELPLRKPPDGGRSSRFTAIKRLFNEIDLDKDYCLSYSELSELISSIRFGMIPYDPSTAAAKIMEELDCDSSQLISEEEFVIGLFKWLNTTYNKHNESNHECDDYQKTWEQTDKLIEDKFIDKSALAWGKAVALVVGGVIMLGLLAEPLTRSVRDFSAAADLPSFYVAFVFVPLATNARLAVSAIKEASKKKLHNNSLTLSEIYGMAFMNNVLGLIVLLSLINFCGINWDFSTEIVMVLAVSTIMGFLTSFSVVFPLWTAFFAYLLYPLSLILVYFLGKFDWLYSLS